MADHDVGATRSTLSWSDCGESIPWATYWGPSQSGPLSTFVDNNPCVQIADGTHVFSGTQLMQNTSHGFLYVRGNGSNTVLKANESMHCPYYPSSSSCFRRLLKVDSSNVKIENLKINGDAYLSNGTMRDGLAGGITILKGTSNHNNVVNNVIFRNLVCVGVQLGGNGNSVKNSNFAYIGGYCPDSDNPNWFGVGAGIYAAGWGGLASWNVAIRDNSFQNLQGTPIDVAKVDYGAITGNFIKNTKGIAGMMLFGNRYFNVLNNTVDNAGGEFNQPAYDSHPDCYIESDNEETAIRICSDGSSNKSVDMTVKNNTIKNSDYGIVLIGSSGREPDDSTIEGNDLWNNPVGNRCMDDRSPGANTWSQSSCNVLYF
ncbi:right-handed parallel beta-helix repeat-containing protein [Nitrosococcus halophilus]|nr:NosD domain-containing protein [Nitrosococcus halophilus]